MALHINKESRTELQERIAAELREKAKKRAEVDTSLPDGVTDSNYLENTKRTTTLSGVWIIIAIVAVVAVLLLVIKST